MKITKVNYNSDFKVIAGNEKLQAAVMVLDPYTSTGGPDNKHDESDQWLYVSSGKGVAIVSGKEVRLEEESLLLIEAGETHEIKNTEAKPLKTLNFYCPPEY